MENANKKYSKMVYKVLKKTSATKKNLTLELLTMLVLRIQNFIT